MDQTVEHSIFDLLDEVDGLVRAALDHVCMDPSQTVRGLHLVPEEVRQSFSSPRSLRLRDGAAVDWFAVAERDVKLAALVRYFGLGPFEVGALLLALAPELDGRYARAYALLQDDVSRRLPSIELCLSLLCDGRDARLQALAALEAEGGPLRRRVLVRVPQGGAAVEDGLRLDPQITRVLGVGGDGLDPRLAESCQVISAPADGVDEMFPDPVTARLRLRRGARGQVVYLRTNALTAAQAAATMLARSADLVVQEVDLRPLPKTLHDIAARECGFFRRLPLIRFDDTPPDALRSFWMACQSFDLSLCLTGPDVWREPLDMPLGAVSIDLRQTTPGTRLLHWRRALSAAGTDAPDGLEGIAERYALECDAIDAAARQAVADTQEAGVSSPALIRAARDQTGLALGKLATRIEPRRDWSALVLPGDTLVRLQEIAARLKNAGQVIENWGFGDISRAARRHAALFAGPSGTGKTLAAEVIAGALGMDLFRVDLAQVVDKYVGETEKNIDRIFTAAEDQDCILFLDECEVLLGKRTEQRDGRDKYANLEAAFLLQRIDDYRGTAFMATNLLGNVDDAFIRRLDFVVHFPFPDEEGRERLWRVACPPGLPLDGSVDFAELGKRYRLSGGNIANCVLAAAYLAAEEGGAVTQEHLLHAVRREYQKMGQDLKRA